MADLNNTSDPKSKWITIHLSMPALVLVCLTVALAVGLLAYSMANTGKSARPSRTQTIIADTDSAACMPLKAVPPWGEVLMYPIDIERPNEYLPLDVNTNNTGSWYFKETNLALIRDKMAAYGLSAQQIDWVLSSQNVKVMENRTLVMPPEELVFSLPQATRAKFYKSLGMNQLNHYMSFPFCYRGTATSEWLGKADLRPETLSLVEQLCYHWGNSVCISDFEVLMRKVEPETERQKLVKALSRQSAVLVKLRIRPNSDIELLVEYWGRGGRRKDIRPLLESLQRLPDGGTIDIVHLVPGFARRRLYTYPLPRQSAKEPNMDCHWTSMNFFNDTPDDRFGDTATVLKHINEQFYPVQKPEYGDVIFFLDQSGNAIHSAVYVAQDIVFTKNGNTHMQPWMLMRLEDLKANYPTDIPLKITVFRNKSW